METLNIKKAKATIALDDSADSPVFTLNLTGKNVGEIGDRIGSAIDKELLAKIAKGTIEDGDAEKLAAVWREVVCAALGKCAYDQIIEYVADGEELEAADVCLFLAPVVEWISNTIIESRGQKAQEAVAKYLDGIGADAI